MAKSTKRLFLVTVVGIPGTWRTSSGGGLTAEVTKDFDGGSNIPDVLGGLPEAEDLEISRTFDPVRDLPIMATLRTQVGRGVFTVTKQATDANFVKVGKPLTYAGCVLTGMTDPESDASSSDVAEFSLTFATTGAV
jgi:hypothetical protein